MATSTRGDLTGGIAAAVRPASGPGGELWSRLSADRAAVVGLGLVLLAVLAGIAGPLVAPYDPLEQNTALRMAAPGTSGYLLGGDHLGRDILSRLLHGARLSLAAAVVPMSAAMTIGLVVGLVTGYYGKAIDMVMSRVLDVLLAFPSILLAIAIASALGPGLGNAMIAIVIVAIPSFARVVRGTVIGLRGLDYIQAAKACGATDLRVLGFHVFPNCLAPIIVYTTLELGRMLIFAAGLSFLGLGAQPPEPEWGAMLSEGRNVLSIAPHVATIPGLAIFVVALGANLMGDGLRDALDPRLRAG